MHLTIQFAYYFEKTEKEKENKSNTFSRDSLQYLILTRALIQALTRTLTRVENKSHLKCI